MRILLIEDDPSLGPRLKRELTNAGFTVDLATEGEKGEFLGATECYDLCILDRGLPGHFSGLEILRLWRESNNPLPVLMLTARSAWHEAVEGFQAGADDYLAKPFHLEELVARMNALLKRSHGIAPSQSPTFEGIELDESRQAIRVGNQTTRLSDMEYRLLHYFMLHPGKIISKTQLLEHLYETDSSPDSNTIEVYVKRLRRKMGQGLIQTRRGQGYVLERDPSDTDE